MKRVPLYVKVKEDLRLQILKRMYKEGDILPSENELCRQYKINRSTVRQALNELVGEGYIRRHHGKGSIVINKKRSLGLFTVKGFTKEVSAENISVKTIMLEKPRLIKWDDDFFYPVSESEKKAGCIYLKRIRYANEVPVMVEQTYIPNINLPDFCRKSFINESLFDTLAYMYNIEIKSVEQEMRAVPAETGVAKNLGIKKGFPVLQAQLKYHTSRTGFFIYSLLFCNTKKYSIGNNIT